ncbi:ComEC/Rec2 family competence protein [Mucilaginibacter sp. McL0603]|uniref:ComEC/Rec2 family competence protein n=1 Tax=Mucilaginibacter sp. McL0603 TaxID=3415670 RepID=UPI003CEBE1C2
MIAEHKGEIPFVVLLLPFLAGIGLGIYFPVFPLILFVEIAFYSLVFVFIVLNLAYKRLGLYKFKWLGGVLMHTILLLLGWVVTINYNELNNKDHFSKSKADYLVVKISNEPKLSGDLLRFTASIEANVFIHKPIPSNGNLLITIKDSTAKTLYYGDELLIPASYQAIDPPFNPAEFNYKKYLANQNIHYQEFLRHHQFYVLSRNAGNPIIAYSLRLRQQLVEKLKRHMHDSEAIAVASTLILGYKADLSNDVLQAYSKTGTIHVLSVSGAHVAILFILLSLILSFMDRFRYGKTIKAILIILIIWYYSLLTGFSPAVCRAAVMISMVIIGKTYSKYINTLNILAISAFFLLLYDPYFITDVGFQLSYLAVAGLIILQPIVYKWINIENKWGDKLWALCSVSIAAQVITFPLSVFYFHQFPVYFLISNLFIIVPSAIIMYAGIGYLLLPDIPFVSSALGWILEKSILIMNKVLSLIEHFPYSGISKIWITNFEYLLLYGIIISVFYFLYEQKAWLIKLSLTFTLLLSIGISYAKWDSLQSDNIVFLNLKKHTGIIFKTGEQAVVLSDLADSDKAYRYSIQPYLDSCSINTIYKVSQKSNLSLSFLIKRGNLVQFRNKKLLIFDKQLPKAALPEKIKLDYLFITDNPDTNIDFLNKYYDYKLLIIDNNNSNKLIARLENQASVMYVNYKTLPGNKSLIITSN